MSESKSAYRRKEWLDFRNERIKIAGHKCERCNRKSGDVVLQVHHPHYEKGRLPWEYEKLFCVVLCKGCHAREHGIIKPADGWNLISSDWDDRSPTGPTKCENCNADMEWWNVIWHAEWGSIVVGYKCADLLGVSEVGRLKRQQERMRTFVNSPRWKQSHFEWNYKHGGRMVRILMQDEKQWMLRIGSTWGKKVYIDPEEAKERAFLVLESRKEKTQ